MKKMLSSFEISTLMFYVMRCSFIGITINNLIYIAKQDSYISILFGFIIGFIPLFLFFYLSKYRSDLNFVELVELVVGKKIGKVLNILFSIFILLFSTIAYWNLINFITSQYLSNTPAIAISIVFLLPTIYLLSKGIVVIAKSSIIIFYICIFLSLLPLIGLFFQTNLDNLLPFMNNGSIPILKGSYIYIANNILPICLLLIIPRDMVYDENKFQKKLVLFYCITSLLLFILFFLTLSIFGVKLAKMYQYPEFHLLKKVSLIGFIQRTESTLSIQWILDIFMSNILALYFFCQSIKTTFQIKNDKIYNIIIITTSIFVALMSNYIFKNNTIGIEFLKFKLPILSNIFFFFFPLLIAFITWIKKIKR